MLSVTDPDVELQFYWRKKLRRCLPNYIGAVRVSIAAPERVTEDEIDRLVFRIPEFFEGKEEILRVDSFHYHRVTSPRLTIPSQKAQRNVLSFQAIQGVWRAGIFDFSHGRLKKSEIERRIRYEITSQVEATLVHYMEGKLPRSRRLLPDEVKTPGMLVLLGMPAADDKRLFASYA